MTHDTTDTAAANTYDAQKLPQPPVLEPADYRTDLAELGLSPEQEREVLEYLWHIVKTVVDAGFGLDAASTVLAAISREVFADPSAPNDATPSKRKDP